MPKYYGMTTSVDLGVAVWRPKLTAAGLGNLPQAMVELTTDKVYEDDEHALIYNAGLERYFRKARSSAPTPLRNWDIALKVIMGAGKTRAEAIAIINERPADA